MFVKNEPTESLLFWRQLIDVLFPPSVTQACDFYVFDILNYCLGLMSQRSDKKWGLDARNSLCYVYAIHLEPFEACFNAYLLLLKPKRARYDTGEKVLTTASLPSPKKQCWSQVSSVYHKSLSVIEKLKLRNVISMRTTTLTDFCKFDMEHMEWSTKPVVAEFGIADQSFASGRFREGFKATSHTVGSRGVTWVLKKYSKNTLDDIWKTGQTAENHTRKAVQMYYLARNLAGQFKGKVENKTLMGSGDTFNNKKGFSWQDEGCVAVW